MNDKRYFNSGLTYMKASRLHCATVFRPFYKMIIFTLSAIAVILCFIHVLLNYNKKALMLRKIPGPPETFILGNGPEIVLPSAELFKLARTYANRWDDIYRYWAFPYGAINIYNPEDIETIISTTRYNEKSAVYSFLKDWLKEGLLVSHGNKWHQRRKILTPAFHFNILREFCVTIEKNSQYLVNTLAKASGEMVDIIPILSEYTLSTICETAMGTQLNEISTSKGKSYKDAIYEIGRLITHRFVSVLLYADFMFNLSSFGRKQKKLLNIIHNFTAEIIKDREEYINKNDVQNINDNSVFEDDVFLNKKRKKRAMLDSIILAKKDGLIDDAGIQEEVDTFMFAGHDTTAAGLTFFIMLLANNPTIQDKIYKELKEVFGGSTRHADIDDLSKLKYLDNCIKESLRLYPPAHFISRQLNETVKLGNYTVPSGVMCHIHIYDLHRRADLFPNPLEFDPDRFLPENSIGRHPYAYIPFSAGPRNCIGQKFAMIQMKSTISTLLRHYEFFPVTKPSDLQLKSDIVLRNSDPVYVKFVNRNK